jgi:hypothetical protein
MAEKSEESPKQETRQFLSDYRSGADRRNWQERRKEDSGSDSYAAGKDLRDQDSDAERRVVLTDRRHATSEGYSNKDAERIRDMILDPYGVVCPQCQGDLLLGRLSTHQDITGRQVHCTSCRRCVIIAVVPEELGSHPA